MSLHAVIVTVKFTSSIMIDFYLQVNICPSVLQNLLGNLKKNVTGFKYGVGLPGSIKT
jgi:hypothetical protein